jgi:hypothetical protein
MVTKSPECDEQLARQGDDQCFARGATVIGRAGLVPLGHAPHRQEQELRVALVGWPVSISFGCGCPIINPCRLASVLLERREFLTPASVGRE